MMENKEEGRREFLRFLLTTGVVLIGAGSMPSLLGSCKKSETEGSKITYDFLQQFEKAEIVSPDKDYVRKISFAITQDSRAVLHEHPDSEIVFKAVPVHNGAQLLFGIGINEQAWQKKGDGVLFQIVLTDENRKRHLIYSRYIDPKNNPAHRMWFDEVIDLHPFGDQIVSFTFRTASGAQGNKDYDWAGWSNPKISTVGGKKSGSTHHTNVILITLDTTRADHLSCYGYSRKTSPHLDELADRSLVFLNGISPSSWTIPAHASLFTGLLPSQHGAISREDKGISSGYPLPPYDFVIARLLRKYGFNTAGFVSGPFLKSAFGFSQGFNTYGDEWVGFDRRANDLNKEMERWLKDNYLSPFFLFINYFDPHAPYNPPQYYDSPFKDRYERNIDFISFQPDSIAKGEIEPLRGDDLARAIDLYDTEILFTDHYLGELFRQLEDYGLLEDSLIIITADHGESFGENGVWGHGGIFIESQVRVPLIIHCPSRIKSPKKIVRQVQTTSLYSTVLSFLNIPVPSRAIYDVITTNLFAVAERELLIAPAYTFAERNNNTGYFGMLRSNRWKYIMHESKDSPQHAPTWEMLFDLAADPKELQNLAGQGLEIQSLMRTEFTVLQDKLAHLKKHLSTMRGVPSAPSPIDSELQQSLKALGYAR